jgi:peptidoglycan hydrolase CwlO-like protein
VNEPLADIARQLAELMAEVRANRSDTQSLRSEIDQLRNETRNEIKALRGDLAVTTAAQNEDISANKKKSYGWSGLRSALFTAD